MKQLNRPTEKVADILNIIKSDTDRNDSILDIDSVVDILEEREALYLNKVDDYTLFEVPREKNISARVNEQKLISYYDYRLVQRPNGRKYYDKMISSAPNDICPYCTIKTVKTIDHFLPKSEYPSYSITPINLVPSCRDCNTEKKISYPTSSDNQTFHPYFDKVDNECWMKAELKKTEPLSFQYDVIKPAGWSNTKFNRATSHFKAYSINQLFSNEANRDLRGMQDLFRLLHSRDRNLLKEHLEQAYNSFLNRLGILDWKTIMYQELFTNEWFLDGCVGVSFFLP